MDSCLEDPILENYIIKAPIGTGAFSKVFLAIHKPTGFKVSIKVIPKYSNTDDIKQQIMIKREIDIMRLLNHPYICDLYETVESQHYMYLVMEYIINGTLLNYINDRGALKEDEAANIFAQIAIAIKYMQSDCNVAHRDIKTENILLDINNNIRIIDFGLSNTPTGDDKLLQTQCGSPAYASPEMIMGQQYTFSSDVWSCGILLYAMVLGTLPYFDENISKLAQKILFKDIELPITLTPNCRDLITRMLTKNPRERITIDQMLAHPFIAEQVQFHYKSISTFEMNEELAAYKLSMMEMEFDNVKKNLSMGVMNQGTVSYMIIRREYMISVFSQYKATKNNVYARNASLQGIAVISALPRLHEVTNGSSFKKRANSINERTAKLISRRKQNRRSLLIV
ncbi:CAMK family protein kinase [Trichomonas vaginalis G3]|uniref:non-specific serine/threonine protein kinase n=1 Tax=Trichomonas vaginalis (strain ATCC PRA-98 / G3) TaxID=412133 RepID=A2FLT8_TRIV3|nr:STKc AMPK-like domain-containing protein [Trichomonas vaginalis G3]EAX94141.1 CAMK family protein kinase [Trichomonas vaginalis G3]KAI5525062.1 STKc AMPK-like domain-containing protein [Trichomonas vaginalis G3]|eukprot:XP_001307071.1 CAMK family protein kinase [Trichomonas vaginalis G3]